MAQATIRSKKNPNQPKVAAPLEIPDAFSLIIKEAPAAPTSIPAAIAAIK